MKDTLNADDLEARRTQIRRVQLEMFGLQSDRGRLARKHTELLSDIHRLQTELAHLQATLAEKMASEAQLIRQIQAMEKEIGRSKKQMNGF